MPHVSFWQHLALSGKALHLCGAILLQIWTGTIRTMSIRHRPVNRFTVRTEIEYHTGGETDHD